MKRKIAITGGIGSGKSVVCHALRNLGYPVYDCDCRARRIMESSPEIRRQVASEISEEALDADGKINRPRLSSIVFTNPDKLRRLNAIVHGAVRADFTAWADSEKADMIFVETAILYESGFDSITDDIWEVSAPVALRVSRVQRRSQLSVDEIMQRMDAQCSKVRPHHKVIINDNMTPLLPQIFKLLQQ